MEAFATGFSMASTSKPGFLMENENYTLKFDGVLCDQSKNIVSHGFENCYSWKEVMELILDATEEMDTYNLVDVEEAAEDALREWLVTFPGWGLLSSVLDSKVHRHVVLSFAYTSANWDQETGGQFSERKVFDTVKYVYDNMPGKEFHTLVPNFGVYFEEILEGSKNFERKKKITLYFNAKWSLEVKFTIEKKRVNNSLLEVAAEAVAQDIKNLNHIKDLNIPETLYDLVIEKFNDAEWVRSFWNAKAEANIINKVVVKEQHENKEENKDNSSENDQNDRNDHNIHDENIIEEEQDVNEEFFASVVDELSSDVEHVLNGDLEPEFETNAGETSAAVTNQNVHGIDGLLSIWVFLFMLIGVIAYIWC